MIRLACRTTAAFLSVLVSVAPLIADDSAESLGTLVETHCLDCHRQAEPSGGLNLESFRADEGATAGADWDSSVWEKMLRRLQARQMPPAEAERPSAEEYDRAIAAMSSILEDYSQRHPRPGRTDSIRRLTRSEYQHAIRDLLQVDLDVTDLLPADESSHGFDNVTVGDLSPVLLNRYLAAAEKISRLAVGGKRRGPAGANFRLPADRTQEAHVDGLPLGTRGGGLVQYVFPRDGDYEVQIRLTRDRDENIEGLHGTHPIDILVDRARVHQFTVHAPRGKKNYERDDTLIDANLKVRLAVTAGSHTIGVTFPSQSASLHEIKRQPFDASYNRHRHPRRNPAIFEISIVGPFEDEGPGDTPSRRRIFSRYPEDSSENAECAREILSAITRRAYRREVSDSDLAVPMKFFREAVADGDFESGIEAALTAILINPSFLLRVERDPEDASSGEVYEISESELASRLSFFLWSSLPDDRLLDLAAEGQLHAPPTLAAEVERMLADERSRSLVTNFASQWLYLRNLQSINPDLRKFPDFDDNLREAFRRETELLFESIVRDDRSVLEFLRSETTYLNERLATHYGIPHVRGSHFRRVKLDPASRRGGLLRHGSILTVTSYATRTSPTIRGNWILENLMGTPPPPPPPNVPSLKEKSPTGAQSVRERLALHRQDAACASCHDLIDPIGFALDNFDAVGRWRDFEDGQAINVSGILPDGTEVRGVDDLEAAMLHYPELFVQTLVEKLLVFALGRGIEPADGPAVRRIVSRARANDYRFSSLVSGIVNSPPFQMRTVD